MRRTAFTSSVHIRCCWSPLAQYCLHGTLQSASYSRRVVVQARNNRRQLAVPRHGCCKYVHKAMSQPPAGFLCDVLWAARCKHTAGGVYIEQTVQLSATKVPADAGWGFIDLCYLQPWHGTGRDLRSHV